MEWTSTALVIYEAVFCYVSFDLHWNCQTVFIYFSFNLGHNRENNYNNDYNNVLAYDTKV